MSITGYFFEAAAWYRDVKRAIGEWTGASQELLHVHAGLLIFVITALILRNRAHLPNAMALALVAVFATLNEFVDWINGPSASALEPYWDFTNTLFWPCILFVLARGWR